MPVQSIARGFGAQSFPITDDSPHWERAWAALSASGRDLDAYMLMSGERADVPGGLRFHFKHCDTRDYVHIPAAAGGCPSAGGPFHRDCDGAS